MSERLQHCGPLFGFVAAPAALAPALCVQTTHSEQLIDIGDGVLLGGSGLVKPEGTEGIKGIGIQIGQLDPLVPHAF